MSKAIAVILIFVLAFQGMAWAEDSPQTPTPSSKETSAKTDADSDSTPKLTPIEIKVGIGGKPEYNGYYHDGQKLESLQQFKSVISPAGDAEADRFLNAYAGQNTAGTVLIGLGGAACIGGLIYSVAAAPVTTTKSVPSYFGGPTATYTSTSNPDTTPFYVLEASGGIALLVGLLVKSGAEQNRQNAVKRYNELVEPGQNLSMIFLPGVKAPALEWTGRF